MEARKMKQLVGYVCMVLSYTLLVYFWFGDTTWIAHDKFILAGSTCIILFFTGADFFLKR